jgi:hypothetical protein
MSTESVMAGTNTEIPAERKKIMNRDNRVLGRVGARELTQEEVEHVTGAGTGCRGTSLHPGGPVVDTLCDIHLP